MRDTVVTVVCVILAAALLAAAGMQLDYINAQRRDMRLTIADPIKGAPPSLAFATAAMGAFRGLVVDILWIRADQLKEQGQFFDARQLAEWITTLQPRFASVWVFHAWNMAYNISVAIPATQPEQRWKWVRNGYELLRDRGIPLNPGNIELYRELARIFQQKVGGVSDDCHKYYKIQLAREMEPLVGGRDFAYFEALAATPAAWNHLLQDPNVAAVDPNILDLMAALQAADPTFTDRDRFVANYLALRQNASRFPPAAGQTIDAFRGAQVLDRFDLFARAYALRTVWKMEPAVMVDLNKRYGPTNFADPNVPLPLDWRHPACHAMYWGLTGLREVAKRQDRELENNEVNTDRIMGHCIQDLFRGGKFHLYEEMVDVVDDQTGQTVQAPAAQVFMRPDLRMFDPYNRILHEVIDKYTGEGLDSGSLESLQAGHRNMLRNAVLLFYQSGHEAKAQEILAELRRRYPREEFSVPLVEYCRNRMKEEFDSIGIHDAKEQVIAMLREAYFRYAIRDDDAAFGREKLARQVYDYYQSQHGDEYRIDLPDFGRMKLTALQDFFADEQYPPKFRQNLIVRIKIERPDLAEQLAQQERLWLQESQTSGRPTP